MNYHIVTKNYYLGTTLTHVICRTQNKHSTCVIDITTIHSLRELYHYVVKYKHSSRFIFIGDNGIYSKVLLSLITIDSKQPVESFTSRIKNCIGVSYNEVMSLLLSLMDMRDFTRDERGIVYSLLFNKSLVDAARHNGVNNKLFYQRLEKVCKKINVVNRFQAYQFFKQEYLSAYI